MNIVITDIDAVRAHRIARGEDSAFRLVPAFEEVDTNPFGSRSTFVKTYLPMLLQLGLAKEGEPLHVHVSHGCQRSRFSELIVHVRSSSLPRGSFWKVVPRELSLARKMEREGLRLFVDCPGLCVITRAAKMPKSKNKVMRRIYPFAKALALASEFCGRFSSDPDNPESGDSIYDIPPIISSEALAEYLGRVSGIDGLAVARKVAEQVADNQGSIREVALYACLVLRPSLGGLNLQKPITNRPLDLKEHQLKLIKHKTLTPDLYWKIYKLVLEYDGSDHFSEEGAWEDKRRVHDYQVLGLTMIPVTSEDFHGVDALDRLLKVVVHQMIAVDGERLRHRVTRILRDRDLRNCRSLLLSTILVVE